MGMVSGLLNSGAIGSKLASLLSGENATILGSDRVATATLHMGQKMFDTSGSQLNLPRPKTLFYVYFHLNPNTALKSKYKKDLINMMVQDSKSSVMTGASESNSVLSSITSAVKDKVGSIAGVGKALSALSGSKSSSSSSTDTKSSNADLYADYIISDMTILKALSYEMSKLVKSCTKPKQSFQTLELNEYNRKRFVYDKVTYNDITITFYDVKESPIQRFFINYLKFINNDNFAKGNCLWKEPIDNNHFMNSTGYKTVQGKTVDGTYVGTYNPFGLTIDSNFRLIDSISICDYYQNKVNVYTIQNPVITDIDFGSNEMGDFKANDIKVTFKYEGITNSLEDVDGDNANISDIDEFRKSLVRYMVAGTPNRQVASFLQEQWGGSTGASLMTDAMNIVKSYMNGEKEFTWRNVKQNMLDTARKYGYANEVNTATQMVDNYNAYKEKEGDDKWKFAVNAATDPTTIIGKVSSAAVSTNNSNTFN